MVPQAGSCYLVGAALNGTRWIRFATAEEKLSDATWCRGSECQPACLVHSYNAYDGSVSVAAHDDPMVLVGDHMQAFEQKPRLVIHNGAN